MTREEQLEAALREMVAAFEEHVDVPARHCNCHVSPPCNDCVEWDSAREARYNAKAALAAPATAQSGMAAGMREAASIARRTGHGGVAEAIEAAIPETAQGVDVAGWEARLDSLTDRLVMAIDEVSARIIANPDALTTKWEMAKAVAEILLTPPATWQPPPEAERPDGFECLGKNSFGIWRHVQWSRRNEWTVRGTFDGIKPTAFAPLPAPGDANGGQDE